jgi:hypothetical protein
MPCKALKTKLNEEKTYLQNSILTFSTVCDANPALHILCVIGWKGLLWITARGELKYEVAVP